MDTLYHYCSTQTFHSIICNKSIRLSSLSLSNDTMEGRLVNASLQKLPHYLELGTSDRLTVMNALKQLETLVDGLGFCLSEEGDLLSQWRGYAQDGSGLSIGFSRSYLNLLAADSKQFQVNQVVYQAEEHAAAVTPTFNEIKSLIAAGAIPKRGIINEAQLSEEQKEVDLNRRMKADMNVYTKAISFLPVLFTLKTAAFKEEKEWRLIAHLSQLDHACEYQARPGMLVPFRTVVLPVERETPIVEVVLGPKHLTPINVVEGLLLRTGFGAAKVLRSAATYR